MNSRSLLHVWSSESFLQVPAIRSLLLLSLPNAVRTCSAGSAGSSRSAALILNVHSPHGRVFHDCYGRFTAHSLDCDSIQAGLAASSHASILRYTLEHSPLGIELQTVLCILQGVKPG